MEKSAPQIISLHTSKRNYLFTASNLKKGTELVEVTVKRCGLRLHGARKPSRLPTIKEDDLR